METLGTKRNSYLRRSMLCCLVVLILVAFSREAPADENYTTKILYLDRIAIALTGLPATDVMKNSLTDGSKSLPTLINEFKQSKEFEKRYAQYWLQVLNITKAVEWTMISKPKKTADGYTGPSEDFGGYLFTSGLIGYGRRGVGVVGNTTYCSADQMGDGFVYHMPTFVPVIDAATNYAYDACGCYGNVGLVTLPDGKKMCPAENCANVVEVSPFWAPKSKVRICRALAQEIQFIDPRNNLPTIEKGFCGSDLSKCWLWSVFNTQADRGNNFIKNISYAFTMEPGVLISRVVSEDRSWDEVLTTSKGYVNGTLGSLLSPNAINKNKYYDGFTKFAPRASATELSYPDWKSFTFDPAEWEKFYEVERGQGLHQGVLTTLAFHRVTNGWRAKANRTMESFLCRKFKVPDDAENPPNDETDLTKKPYCKLCHTTLEPMAQFFGNWPNIGDASYFYNELVPPVPNPLNPSVPHSYGSFNGQSGSGVQAFANILINMNDYNECAVRRAFEFLNGRDFTRAEEEMMLKPLTDKFVSENKKIWPILLEILSSPSFKGDLK